MYLNPSQPAVAHPSPLQPITLLYRVAHPTLHYMYMQHLRPDHKCSVRIVLKVHSNQSLPTVTHHPFVRGSPS